MDNNEKFVIEDGVLVKYNGYDENIVVQMVLQKLPLTHLAVAGPQKA